MSATEQPKRGNRPARGAAGLDRRRAVFMISVAAELAEMHPQTLRMYEARGLVMPKRSPKNTRLYSYEDVERLRRIQRMTAGEGLNLAGVETVLSLERELERARAEVSKMRRRAAALEQHMTREIDRVRRSLRMEIVPYGKYNVPPASSQGASATGDPSSARIRPGAAGSAAGRVSRQSGDDSVSIPIERRRKKR